MAKSRKQKKQTQRPEPPDKAVRPTEQRLSRGKWALPPAGPYKSERPFVDLSSDAVGKLYEAGGITAAQEQAARQFQRARADYIAELPDVEQFKSCIAGSVPGFDDGDGDPEKIERYRKLEKLIGVTDRRIVLAVCEDNTIPAGVGELKRFRAAMERIAK